MRIVRRAFVLALAGTAGFLLSACADRVGRAIAHGAEGESQVWEVHPPDWDNPENGGFDRVSGLNEAKAKVTFDPLVPTSGPQPEVFTISSDESLEDQSILLVFQDAAGPYWIVQGPAEMVPEDLVGIAEMCQAEPDCSAEASMAKIRNGVQALVLRSKAPEGSTVVAWIEKGLEISVKGPVATFSLDRALEVADSL